MNSPAQSDHPKESPWEDLVVSILSVNQYSLERTYGSVEGLRKQKITEVSTLMRSDSDEIEQKLKAAGCDRGPFMTKLFAVRLSALGAFIQAQGADECERVLESQNAKAIESLLLPIKGIGPVVLKNFYLLRGISPR